MIEGRQKWSVSVLNRPDDDDRLALALRCLGALLGIYEQSVSVTANINLVRLTATAKSSAESSAESSTLATAKASALTSAKTSTREAPEATPGRFLRTSLLWRFLRTPLLGAAARAGEGSLQLLPEVVLGLELAAVRREKLLLGEPLGPEVLLALVVAEAEGCLLAAGAAGAGEGGLELLPEVVLGLKLRGVLSEEGLLCFPLGPEFLLALVLAEVETAAGAVSLGRPFLKRGDVQGVL